MLGRLEDLNNFSRILHRFTLFLVLYPHEESVMDLLNLKLILKTKEKTRIFCDNLCQNLENLINILKTKEKKTRVKEKAKFLKCLPLEKMNSFMEELIFAGEMESSPIFKKIISNLIIFFSYFWNEDCKFVCIIIESYLKKFTIEELGKENNREMMNKLLKMGLKKKRFTLFDIISKLLFTFKYEAVPKVFEFFFEAISKELKSMDKCESNSQKEEELRMKFIFICDLITRFTHQLELRDFYGADFNIRKLIKIEEIFTKQVFF